MMMLNNLSKVNETNKKKSNSELPPLRVLIIVGTECEGLETNFFSDDLKTDKVWRLLNVVDLVAAGKNKQTNKQTNLFFLSFTYKHFNLSFFPPILPPPPWFVDYSFLPNLPDLSSSRFFLMVWNISFKGEFHLILYWIFFPPSIFLFPLVFTRQIHTFTVFELLSVNRIISGF